VKNTTVLLVLWFCIASSSVYAQNAEHEPVPRCHAGAYRFKGKVLHGQTFSRKFGGFVFTLLPGDGGDWHIEISQGQRHGFEGLTGPLHFVPNPTDIEGWHFRNAANTGPNSGDVNAPGKNRHFLFSPHWPRCEASDLKSDGQGMLEITDMKLENLKPDEKATITMMAFKVTLSIGRSACKAACPGIAH
jgi:hypothetical protein